MKTEVAVIGAGPAGVLAALRAAELGARTTLVTRDAFGGMAANDGPVPVRTLAYASRLLAGTRQLGLYGITVGTPALDYSRLLDRVRNVVEDVRRNSALRDQIDRLGVTLHEHAGNAAFTDAHTLKTTNGLSLHADRIILCPGGTARRLTVPGAELAATVSDAWSLTRVPESMLVIGAGMTGVQVASIFQSFGSRVTLFQAGPRILPGEDEDVSAAIARAFRSSGMTIREDFGVIEKFEKTTSGVRMTFSKDGTPEHVDASLAVVTIGWIADTDALNLRAAGIEIDNRGYVAVNDHLRTSAPHVYAAGDVTGRWMLAPQAMHDGWIAATNAVRGDSVVIGETVSPTGGFTDPEYARVGLTEARAGSDVIVATIGFDETTRTIIDGRTTGFCKLLVDRSTRKIAGCHVVGERAVEIVQVAAIAMASGMRVDDLARIPLSFPTYTGVLGRVSYRALEQIGGEIPLQNPPEGTV